MDIFVKYLIIAIGGGLIGGFLPGPLWLGAFAAAVWGIGFSIIWDISLLR